MTDTIDSMETLRNQLLANGYSPIPNVDKQTFYTGWPTVEITPELIHKWRRMPYPATGLRIENGLAAIDFDINHPIIDTILDRVAAEFPELAELALVRYGKGRKEAWFCRADEPFGRIHSIKWVAPGETKDDGTHMVEIFGGASARQFGSFGPHSHNEDGSVAVEYEWLDDVSPANTPLADLIELQKPAFLAIRDIVDVELRKAGFTEVASTKAGEGDARWAHDLTDDMVFNCNDGLPHKLADLANMEGMRCSASFIEPDGLCFNTSRCLIGKTGSGEPFIWDTAEDVRHTAFKEKAPDRSLDQVAVTRMMERMDSLKAAKRHRPNAADDAMQVATKIAATYAFCAQSKEAIIPIYEPSAQMTLTAFRTFMLPYAETEVGPRGGEKKINPVDIWAASTDRLNVRGIRLRPDKYSAKSPVFEENGNKWVNSYNPPLHDATGGEAQTFREFMRHLLQEQDEHDWFMQWLAYKFQHPEVPGAAVIMVAQEQGTGRGTLFEILAKLFGPEYAITLPFADLTGRNSQSVYNSWQATSLIACVNESAEMDAGTSEHKQRVNTYEHIKEMVDPGQQRRAIKEKFEKEYRTPSFVSFIIASNHRDALPITDDDRRFAVLRSDLKLRAAANNLQDRIHSWMQDDANVAELARYLYSYDTAAYDPYDEPIVTDGKIAMAQSSKSEVDHAFKDALDNLGDVFTVDHVIGLCQAWKAHYDADFPDNWQWAVKRMVVKRYDRVGVQDGTNWKPTINDKRRAVYAKTRELAKHWRLRADLREEVELNGKPSDQAKRLSEGLNKLRLVANNT
jgi:hypothetical protein